MAWFSQSQELKEDIVHFEERLAIITKSQDDLNRHTQEIKNLTLDIIRTLDANVSNDILIRLAPILESIPSLLGEMTPAIQSIAARFADLHQSQLKIQGDISSMLSMITAMSTQPKNVD